MIFSVLPLAAAAGDVDGDFILKLIAALSLLANFILLLRQFTGAGEKREVGPQPFRVKAHEEFVPTASFHKHAELNRLTHEALEKEQQRIEHELTEALTGVRVELSAVKALREENGGKLNNLETLVGTMAQQFHELAGAFHQFAKQGGRKA